MRAAIEMGSNDEIEPAGDDVGGESAAKPTGAIGKISDLVGGIFDRLTKAQWLAQLGVRFSVGYMFMIAGKNTWGDLAGHIKYFESLNIPFASTMTPFVVLLELVGGALLIVGLGTRKLALMLSGVMVVALLTQHVKVFDKELSNLFYHSDFLLFSLLIWLVFAGPGKASVDYLLKKLLRPGA